MLRTSVVIAALLVGPAVLGGPAASSEPSAARAASAKPASYEFLKAQVFTAPGLGSIAVGMPSERVVKVQHRTEGGEWSRPSVLFRKEGVTCGAIDGRTSPGGVAVLLECDTPYYEDQAPVHSMAFVTRDLATWTGKRLKGEAYKDPAISADGSHAAWLYGSHGQYELFSDGSGFTTGQTSFDYDSGGEAVVVDGAGTVTVMGSEGTGGGCVLSVYDQPLSGPEDHYVIDGVEPGCTESGVDNVDDRTVVGSGNREHRYVITRVPGQRWALTRPAPVDTPGLVTYRGGRKKVIRNVFSDAAGQSLVSIGSPDRQRIFVQVFDDEAHSWGPSTLVHDQGAPRCQAHAYHPYEPRPRLHAVPLRCAGGTLLLTSPDSATWTTTRLGHRPYALSRSGALLAAPGETSTRIVSLGGTTTVPVTALGHCDFVFPIGTDSVLRLHGGAQAPWPTRLQRSVAGGRWQTIQTVRMPKQGSCRRINALHYDPPSMFFLSGDGQYVSLRVRRDGEGGWQVEHFSF